MNTAAFFALFAKVQLCLWQSPNNALSSVSTPADQVKIPILKNKYFYAESVRAADRTLLR